MNIKELFFVNIFVTCFPILIYIIFVTFKSKFKKGEKNIYLEVLLFFMFFSLMYVYNKTGLNEFSCCLAIPVLVGYLYNKPKTCLTISTINVLYIYSTVDARIEIIIIMYLSYYILYLKHKDNRIIFSILFIISTFIFMIISMYLYTEYSFGNMYVLILFYTTACSILFIIYKVSNLLNTYENIKDIRNEKKIRTFMCKVTHEMKNPLVVIKGYLEILNNKNLRINKEVLLNEVNHALDIVSDFKDLYNLSYNKTVFSFNELLKDFKYEIIPFYNDKHITTRFCTDKNIIIYGDKKRIKQVLMNIVKNSIEAMKYDGKLYIKSHIIDNSLKISIKDNGCGMNEEEIVDIFKPFNTNKKNGTGLGLCISKEIIEEHKGTIIYHSKINKYTIVDITLPINNMDIHNYNNKVLVCRD